MQKSQKKLLYISLGIFTLIEIFFSPIISFVAFLFGITDFKYLYELLINSQFFLDNQAFSFAILFIEFSSVLAIFILNLKVNRSVMRSIISVISVIILLLILFFLYLAFNLRNGVGF